MTSKLSDERDLRLQGYAELRFDSALRQIDERSNIARRRRADVDENVRVDV